MFQPVNRDKFVNYKCPRADNIYVDLTIPCTDTSKSAESSYYQIARNNIILPKAADYYATMDSLEIPSETIPKFMLFSVPEADAAGEYPYRLDYAIRASIRSPDWTPAVAEAYLTIDQQQFVSSDNRFSTQIKYVNGVPVWFLYSVKEFLFIINQALAVLGQKLQQILAGQAGAMDTYYDNQGICFMFMEESTEGRLRFLINDDLLGYPNTGAGRSTMATGPDVTVIFSDTLYYMLGKFLCYSNQINLNQAGYNLNNRESIYRYEPIHDISVQLPTGVYPMEFYQQAIPIPNVATFENDNLINDLQQMFKIVCEVGLIPVQNTLNGNSKQDGGKYLITFIPDASQGFDNNYIFKPLNASKLNDILSDNKLQELSFKFYVLDYVNNRYEIFIPIYKAAILRCLFIKKQLFNNFYQSDTLIRN